MYVVVNTMSQTSDTLGMVMSRHKTFDNADRQSDKIQRMVKRANGQQSYLPLQIVKTNSKATYLSVNDIILDD